MAVPTPKPEPIGLTAGKAKVAGTDADVVRFKDRVVYRFEADENKPPKVNCVGDCLVIWPPLLTDGTPVKLAGVNPGLVGSVQRADGLTRSPSTAGRCTCTSRTSRPRTRRVRASAATGASCAPTADRWSGNDQS